ncbi:Minus agglutinin [Rhodotorula toruloides ATCC 204091]|nr:Minus agglutinin [Rhodotorula toruloides ATCC 204091]
MFSQSVTWSDSRSLSSTPFVLLISFALALHCRQLAWTRSWTRRDRWNGLASTATPHAPTDTLTPTLRASLTSPSSCVHRTPRIDIARRPAILLTSSEPLSTTPETLAPDSALGSSLWTYSRTSTRPDEPDRRRISPLACADEVYQLECEFEHARADKGQKSRVEDDGTLERAPKRVRVAPDHEAFGRLSLSTAAGGPASPTTLTYSPLSTVPSTLPTPFTTGGAPPPTPLLLNTSHLPPSTLTPVSFPPSAPSSAASSSFHPQPHAPSSSPPISAPSLPAAPPTSPVQSASTSGLRSPIRGAGAGTSLPTVPWSQSSFISPPPPPTSLATEQAGQAEEIDMRSASSSWPTGPHTIYVSSLDSDSDTEAPAPVKEVEVNPLALRGGTDDPASRLLLSKLHEAAHSSSSSAGELILYRPPPSFAPPPPLSSPEPELEAESAKSRILRERRAKRTSDEWGEFVRMREREEAMHDFGDEEEPAVVEEDGMEMD